MNVENNSQSLIADIDRLLVQANSETTRQTLERVRTYLTSSQHPLVSEAVDLMAQKILAEVNYKLNDWLEALQIELMAHRQERQALLADIEQLQHQRQKILNEFLAALMNRTQEVLQQPSEQFLTTLETNLQTVFTTLEKDLQGYYESLSQGLERMHYLGQQGEAKLIAYVHRLSQQLEQTPEIQIKASQKIPPLSKIQNRTQWYLGLDINPLGLAAVLLKHELTQVEEYPLLWQVGEETVFRLPDSPWETLSFLKQSHRDIPVKAAQLSEDLLRQVLEQLDGVSVHLETEILESIPNVRSDFIQVILEAKLVNEAEKIIFVEGAIATLLSHLSFAKTLTTTGTTLVIYGGIFATQLALVEIPPQVQSLSWEEIKLGRWDYGDRTLDQDILCQLIYPQWASAFAVSLPQLTIPQAGTPDFQTRQILTTQLNAHPLGQSLLEAAKLAKLILGHQTTLTSQLLNHSWTVQRQDLEEQVIFPCLHTLESAIISFLSQHHRSVEDIGQIICNGEFILSLGSSVSRTLEELFPRKPLILVAQREPIGQIVRGTACLPLFPALFNSRENIDSKSV